MNPIDKYLNINPAECLKGFEHTHENAKYLLSSAKLLSKNNKIGPATSLAILAGEEALKSFLLFCKALQIDIPARLSIYFKSHQTKHNTIRLLQVLSKPMEYLFDSAQDWLKKRAEDPSQVPERPWPYIIPKFQLWVKHNITDPTSEVSLENNWWEHANLMKNEGFYVDFKVNTWKIPSKLSTHEYSMAVKYSEDFIKQLDLTRTVPFEDHTQFIEIMKKRIKIQEK
ncbi:MAG: AbiV family abortive infection protein [Phycisphaerales bacterium]|jgi:AbiV family abortive infection protein